MILSLAAAVAAAIGYGVSTVMQAVATRRASGLSVLAQPLVIGGFVIDGLSWLLSLVALNHLPLFVVQSILASSLVVTVALARFALSAPMRPIDGWGMGAVVIALVALGAAGGEQPAPTPPGWLTTTLIAVSVGLAVAAAALYRSGAPVLLAVVGALGYSGAAIAARAAHTSDGLLDTVFQPVSIAIVVFGAVGVLSYLRSLEHGRVGTNAAILSVVEVVVPGVVGLALMGDSIRPGWIPTVIVAAVLSAAGCLVLATSPANETAEAADEPGLAPVPAGDG